MKTNHHILSKEAVDLIEKKGQLSPIDYTQQLESIVKKIAENSNEIETPETQLGIVEKMSFELRTPMNSILGFTGLLKDSYFTRAEKSEFINLIEKNTQQLVQLLSDLTDLTRVENQQVIIRNEKFELNVFILSILSKFNEIAKEKNIVLDKVTDEKNLEDVCIFTDPYQLKHILENLIQNLINFSANSKVHVNVALKNHILTVKIISENSVLPETISNSIKKHISYSPKENAFDGTGLRLTLTKALIDLLKGRIEFNCIPNIGSEFVVQIPVFVCDFKKH